MFEKRRLLFPAIAWTLLAAGLLAATAAADEPPLLPRRLLLGDPLRMHARVSPDGAWLAYLAPAEGASRGPLNIFLAPSDRPEQARQLTRTGGAGIREFAFAYDGHTLLYPLDEGGDENYRLFALDLRDGASRALTPPGARAALERLSPRIPGAILITLNDRDPAFFDVVRIELATGARQRLVENREFAAFLADDHFQIRLASRQSADGGKEWLQPDGAGWRLWQRVAPDDALTTSLLDIDGDRVQLLDSRGRDRAALVEVALTGGDAQVLHADAAADVESVLRQPRSSRIQAALATALRDRWHALDPALAGDLAALEKAAAAGSFRVVSRSLDDSLWVVELDHAERGPSTLLYRRGRGLEPFFAPYPLPANARLGRLHAVEITSRDGLKLPSYYLLPAGSDAEGDGLSEQPLPLVLRVHGGPWDRDRYGWSGLDQWLANRGYAVLLVNFRGSTGFGKKFVNAGNLEWGRKMQHDLLDAVAWAIEQKIADPKRVAILGSSYGGYAALRGLSDSPDVFACGISVVGPSNLETLLASVPPYWQATRRLFTNRVGDPDQPEGRRLLAERSPLHQAANITRSLLIGQGANDPRVPPRESEQIVDALRRRNAPVIYALFPDEGHGFARPENALAFSALVEEFLATCLGGRVEPPGNDLQGTSLQLKEGASLVPATAAALARAGQRDRR